MTWQAWSTVTVTGEKLAPLPVSSFPWGRALSSGKTAKCSIPLDALDALGYSDEQLDDLTAHWKRTIVLEHDGVPVFWGTIRDHNTPDRVRELQLTDIWGIWARRGAWDHSVEDIETWSVTYTDLSLRTLAKRAVQRGTTGLAFPVMTLPVTLESDVPGSVEPRTHYGYHLEMVADVLDDLALEGVKIDFRPRWLDGVADLEMVTDPEPTMHEWNINAPEGGVSGFRRNADGAKMTNNAIFVGEGAEAAMLVAKQADEASDLPLLDRVESRKHITDVSQLQALADEGSIVYGPATDAWSFDILAGGDVPVEEINLNDTARLTFSGQPGIPDGIYDRRIVSISGDVVEKVTITCQATVASGGVDHAEARQELDRLQRRVRVLETQSPMNHTSVTYTSPDYPDGYYSGFGLIGIGIDVVQAISRSTYDAITPNPTTLYAIDESS